MTASPGPHAPLVGSDPRERFLAQLFDRLWDAYRERVSYVRTYEEIVRSHGATFVNDHIAFRTLASQRPVGGIVCLSRIFEALGYRAVGVYQFEDKHLGANHFQHPNPRFPKLFISELRTWELGPAAAKILQYASRQRPPVEEAVLSELHGWSGSSGPREEELLQLLLRQFQELPWPVPERRDVEAVNSVSQYAAWVLVHGYNVNHFTALVNSHGTESLNDLEKTLAALREAGVPVKSEIEGELGSKLRQSATEAVRIEVNMLEQGQPCRVPWSYAYFELAERNAVLDPETGKWVRFEGFLGAQATHLFEMTRLR